MEQDVERAPDRGGAEIGPHLARARRIALGIAAISGLVSAACVSGLPAATCEAIAETYMRAIVELGTIGTIALAVAIGLEFMAGAERAAYALVGTVALIFFLSANAGLFNLRVATGFCLLGPDKEVGERAHQQTRLLNLFDLPAMIKLESHSFFDAGIVRP